MKNIKFRIFKEKIGMIYFDLFDLDRDYIIPSACYLDSKDYIMQYTGLKDKKRTKEYPEGQEIYEGDIVKIKGSSKHYVVGWFFEGCSFSLYRIFEGCKQLSGYNLNNDIEIIGYIKENPELIGEK